MRLSILDQSPDSYGKTAHNYRVLSLFTKGTLNPGMRK
jgi:hypothetical protein